MLSIITARVRGRIRRALLGAALPAALAAVTLPAAAEANNVSFTTSSTNEGLMQYVQSTAQPSSVATDIKNGAVHIRSSTGIQELFAPACRRIDSFEVSCPGGEVDRITAIGHAGNDTYVSRTALPTLLFGLTGDDTYFGGAHPLRNRVDFSGGAGTDNVHYGPANRGVRVDTADGLANDGRVAFDEDNIRGDVERIDGSIFADVLFGSAANNIIVGYDGGDEIGGGDGNDIIDEGASPNGADSINGGGGSGDLVTYGTRTSGVSVTLDGVRNDGATGENDDVRPNVERVSGTNHADVLIGNALNNVLVGFGGDDIIDGGAGNDELVAGSGVNRLFGNVGDDFLVARNGQRDTLDCGADADRFDIDTSEQSVSGCETRAIGVGTLRLTPKSKQAKAGQVARLRLTWRHPRAWKLLRTIKLRLTRHGVPAGEIDIRPREGQIDAGAIELLRGASRVTRTGKTVTARLALRLDESLAGQTLQVEVEATDKRGRRQLERDAGSIRVAK